MKYLLLFSTALSLGACSDIDAKREAAADAAFDAAYNHCVYNLKKSPGECEAYMERNWQQFYREPE